MIGGPYLECIESYRSPYMAYHKLASIHIGHAAMTPIKLTLPARTMQSHLLESYMSCLQKEIPSPNSQGSWLKLLCPKRGKFAKGFVLKSELYGDPWYCHLKTADAWDPAHSCALWCQGLLYLPCVTYSEWPAGRKPVR